MYMTITSKPQPISELSTRSGPIEVEGTAVIAEKREPVPGLFTGTKCLAYEYSTQAPKGSGPSDASFSDDGKFEVLDKGRENTTFVVEDDTGRVLVDPTEARFEFLPEYYYNAPLSDTPKPVEKYMQQHPESQPPELVIHPMISHIMNNHNRFVERRLDIGDTVYVKGSTLEPAGWDSDESILVRDGADNVEFVVYDRSKRRTAWRYGIFGSGKVIAGIIGASIMSFILYENVLHVF